MYCDEILRYSYLHYIFLYCLQLIKYLWCPFEHVLDNASNAQTLCKIKIQDFTRSFPMSKIFVVFLSSFATGQTRCYGGCGDETPHWACFSREICNFTRQNGDISLWCVSFMQNTLLYMHNSWSASIDCGKMQIFLRQSNQRGLPKFCYQGNKF